MSRWAARDERGTTGTVDRTVGRRPARAASVPSSTASSSERGERQSPASSTRSPRSAGGRVLGDTAEREDEGLGRDVRSELGREHVPEPGRPATVELVVLDDLDPGAVEPLR